MTDATIEHNRASFDFWYFVVVAALITVFNIAMVIYFAYDAAPDDYKAFVHYGYSQGRSTANLIVLSVIAFFLSISILKGSWRGRHRVLV